MAIDLFGDRVTDRKEKGNVACWSLVSVLACGRLISVSLMESEGVEVVGEETAAGDTS